MDGILNIYKEQDYTSFDVVAKLRKILKQKKIGHTGTLDPMAEGVLLVCLGKGTKLVDLLTEKDKEYEAVMLLGITTDTEDITGTILKENEVLVSSEEVINSINSFLGEYDQIPPMYSAIKKDGKKLYEYARAGIEIEREPRRVDIKEIEILEINIPEVRFSVKCSKGTYIRSLCRDIGEDLKCGATLKSLVRKEVNGFFMKDSLKLSEVSELVDTSELEKHLIPIDRLLDKWDRLTIKSDYEKMLINGNKLCIEYFEENVNLSDNNFYRVYNNNEFIALYEYDLDNNIFRPYKMFL